MAASSTGFSGFPKLNFGPNFFNAATGPIWTAEVLSSGDPNAIWEDGEDKLPKMISELKKEFHRDRYLLLKHLPLETTQEDVRSMLKDYAVQSVLLQPPTGRVKLLDPAALEDWDTKKEWRLGRERTLVGACPSPTEGLLCVAHLPPKMNDDQFRNLVAKFGEIRCCFLMKSEKTGESKGYGFVEYTAKEVAFQAKSLLSGRRMGEWTVSCDWVDSGLVTLASLHSRCLRVDGLPKDYRDMMTFRKLCGAVVTPPYCQIVLRNGTNPDFGLVEFENGIEAELTQEKLSETTVWGQRLRVSYWIPGVRAINIYMAILNNHGDKGHTPLMPSPPSETVFKQLQNLTKHNPQFAQNLQNIILTHIQDLQQGPLNPSRQNKGNGVLGKGLDPGTQENLTTNAKSALALILAAQMQAPTSNPQVSSLVQNVLKLGGGVPAAENPPPVEMPPTTTPPWQSPTPKVKPIYKNGFLPPRPLDIPPNGWPTQTNGVTPTVRPSTTGANMLNSLLENAGVMPRAPSFRSVPPPPPHPPGAPPLMRPPPPTTAMFDKGEDLQDTVNKLVNNIQNLKQLLGNLNRNGTVNTTQENNGMPAANDVLSMLVQALGSPQAPLSPLKSGLVNPLPFNAQYPPDARPPVMNGGGRDHLQQFNNMSSLLTTAAPTTSPHVTVSSRNDAYLLPACHWSPPTTNGYSTPIGQKRKHNHILPSPEPSPENGYVGQHSQGLGGHYADSYSKRKKRE